MERLKRLGQVKGFRHTVETKSKISATMKGRAPLAIHIKRNCPTCGILMGAGNLGRHAPICAALVATGPFVGATVKEMKIARRRLKPYGITPEDYTKKWNAQGGVCNICGGDNEIRALAVDHCHTTGRIRGLLCDTCNVMLGCAKDKPALLLRAAQYLEHCDVAQFDPWKD